MKLRRRDLVTLLGAGLLAPRAASAVVPRHDGRGRVGVAALAAKGLTREGAGRALGAAVAAATGAHDGAAAMGALFSPRDTVGIKLSCLGGRSLSPHVEVVEALVDLLAGAGVERGQVIVFERSSRELERAGFALRRERGPYLCYGVDGDWDRTVTVSGEIGSCYAHLVSTVCTALISVAVVKDHDLAGVSGTLKNFYGVIHNPNKYHDNGCDPFVADVVRHPFVAGKLRLAVLDGVRAQCHGGPGYRADAGFALGRVAAGTDPVALDFWEWRVIDAERRRRGMPTLAEAGRPPRHLATAAARGLGSGDPEVVEEVSA